MKKIALILASILFIGGVSSIHADSHNTEYVIGKKILSMFEQIGRNVIQFREQLEAIEDFPAFKQALLDLINKQTALLQQTIDEGEVALKTAIESKTDPE